MNKNNQTIESRELALYATDNYALYHQTITPILNNLAKKIQKGIFDNEKAVIALEKAAKVAAEMYVHEFGGTVKACFPRSTRLLAAAEMLEHYTDEIIEKAGSVRPRYTIADIKQINRQTGLHFFDKNTMSFWGSKIETGVHANLCFVTSEDNFDRTKKLFTIRRFIPKTGQIETVGKFQAYSTLAEAKEAIARIK